MDLCVIPVSCDIADYENFEKLANQRGMDLSQWIVLAAKMQVPAGFQSTPTPQPTTNSVMDEAHRELDRMEIETGSALPPAPVVAKAPAPKQAPAAVPSSQPGMSGHPCSFLAAGMYPHNQSAKTCLGTCTAPDKNGAPCFWAAAVAKNCMSYRGKGRPGHF